jgi:hypothetical protein
MSKLPSLDGIDGRLKNEDWVIAALKRLYEMAAETQSDVKDIRASVKDLLDQASPDRSSTEELDDRKPDISHPANVKQVMYVFTSAATALIQYAGPSPHLLQKRRVLDQQREILEAIVKHAKRHNRAEVEESLMVFLNAMGAFLDSQDRGSPSPAVLKSAKKGTRH